MVKNNNVDVYIKKYLSHVNLTINTDKKIFDIIEEKTNCPVCKISRDPLINIFFINYLKYSIPDSNSFWSIFPGTFIIFPL